MQEAVFLDRDNTLIANDGDLGNPERVVLLDGVRAGLARLHEHGLMLVVVTNQGGVARGRYEERDVDLVHERISSLVGAETPLSFYYCPYHPRGTVDRYTREHPWRKPAPGMLLAAAQEHEIDLARSWMVGDQPRDADAGRAAGCKTILIGEFADGEDAQYTVKSFADAIDIILENAE